MNLYYLILIFLSHQIIKSFYFFHQGYFGKLQILYFFTIFF